MIASDLVADFRGSAWTTGAIKNTAACAGFFWASGQIGIKKRWNRQRPLCGAATASDRTPNLLRRLDHQPQLGTLRFDRDVVAVHGAAEAALR